MRVTSDGNVYECFWLELSQFGSQFDTGKNGTNASFESDQVGSNDHRSELHVYGSTPFAFALWLLTRTWSTHIAVFVSKIRSYLSLGRRCVLDQATSSKIRSLTITSMISRLMPTRQLKSHLCIGGHNVKTHAMLLSRFVVNIQSTPNWTRMDFERSTSGTGLLDYMVCSSLTSLVQLLDFGVHMPRNLLCAYTLPALNHLTTLRILW